MHLFGTFVSMKFYKLSQHKTVISIDSCCKTINVKTMNVIILTQCIHTHIYMLSSLSCFSKYNGCSMLVPYMKLQVNDAFANKKILVWCQGELQYMKMPEDGDKVVSY